MTKKPHPGSQVFKAHHLFNPKGNHADPEHTKRGPHVSTNDFAFGSIGENGYRDYATASRKSDGAPDYYSDTSFVIGFHLSADGGQSWSRLLYLYSDSNQYAVSYIFREYTDLLGDPRADSHPGFSFIYFTHDFFDTDISSVGDDLGRPGINHIWGFKESENLWFNGSRKLSFGDIKHHVKNGQKYGKVWYEMRDIGGKPGKNDTVLLNHGLGQGGLGPNVYAVLYDY